MFDIAPHCDHTVNGGHTEIIRAVFCDEFEVDGVDGDRLATIGHGDVENWVSDLRLTGLFLPGEIEAIEDEWSRDPGGLVSALVSGTDEIARRRGGRPHLRAVAERRVAG